MWPSAGKELPCGHLLEKSCRVAICWERIVVWLSAGKELPCGHLLGQNCLVVICRERVVFLAKRLCCAKLDAVLGVCVSFLFDILGRTWNLIVIINEPAHEILVLFVLRKLIL